MDEEEWRLLNEALDRAGDEDKSPTVLHGEASGLRRRAGKLMESLEGDDLERVKGIIVRLDGAMAGDDVDQLQEAIDEATTRCCRSGS